MTSRIQHLVVGLLGALAACCLLSPASAAESDLSLSLVSAKGMVLGDDLFIHCQVSIQNTGKSDIAFQTKNAKSIYDGLVIEVRSLDGKLLGKAQHKCADSVPVGHNDTFAPGATQDFVNFTIEKFSYDKSQVHLQVTGKLLDDAQPRAVTTDKLKVRLQQGLWAGMMLSSRTKGPVIHIFSDGYRETGVQGLIGALKHQDPGVRESAAGWLEAIGPWAEPALPALRIALQDPDMGVAGAADEAIKRIEAGLAED